MSDDTSTMTDAQDRLNDIRETEHDTKMAYVVVAGLFAANAAGVFAATIPSAIFALAFVGLLVIDAAT